MDKVLSEIKNIAIADKRISKVILFGSRARGDNTPQSDYDIAVFSDMDAYMQSEFSERIDNIKTLNKIDIVFIKERHIDTELYKNISAEGKIIMDRFVIKLNNYKNALARLHESIIDSDKYENLTFRDGVIQRFEFTAELAWKTTREYLINEGITDINSPKSVMRGAYAAGLIKDEGGWLRILDDRNSTSHIYDEDDAAEIYERIKTAHIKLFDDLLEKLDKKGE